MIPYGRQSIDAADLAAVAEVLKSDFLTQGPAVPRFEAAFVQRCQAPHAAAVSSATAALHLACVALGVGPGDRVWTSPITFVASANCARYCGADVDFVDIDPRTYNLSPDRLEEKLTAAAKKNRLPKVLIPVHFSGQPCDMARIGALAKQYGVAVVEDASHAVGAEQHGRPVGSCELSDMAVFSFHPVKIITTGEGGLLLTRRADLFEKLVRLRSHGIEREIAHFALPADGGWWHEQQLLGWNYRLTDIQAALGLSQLRRLDAFLTRRRALAAAYERKLAALPLTRPFQSGDGVSSWHLYVVQLDRRREVYDALRGAGVGAQVHYIPVHTQPYYRALGFKPGDFPESERYYARCLTLPLYPDLSDAQLDEVVAKLARALRA